MSDQAVLVARFEKLEAKKLEKARLNLVKYPYAIQETLVFDASANKNKCDYCCVTCGKISTAYTSDLGQLKGRCSGCRKEARKASKAAERRALAEFRVSRKAPSKE